MLIFPRQAPLGTPALGSRMLATRLLVGPCLALLRLAAPTGCHLQPVTWQASLHLLAVLTRYVYAVSPPHVLALKMGHMARNFMHAQASFHCVNDRAAAARATYLAAPTRCSAVALAF